MPESGRLRVLLRPIALPRTCRFGGPLRGGRLRVPGIDTRPRRAFRSVTARPRRIAYPEQARVAEQSGAVERAL